MMKIHCGMLSLGLAVQSQRFYCHDNTWKNVFNARCLLYFCIILQNTVTSDVRTAPQSATVVEGENFAFDCTVRPAEPRVPIKWYRNDKLIAALNTNNENPYVPSNKYTATAIITNDFIMLVLTIKNIEVSDSGYTYICTAEFNDRPLSSEITELRVTEMPDSKYPLCEPREQSFNENAIRRLRCRSEDIEPAVTLKWYKNSQELETTENHDYREVISTYDFEVKYEDNNAEFLCVQSSKHIPKLNGNCTIGPIFVNFLPRVSIEYRGHKNSSAIVKYNEVNVLICQAKTPHANPTFKWKFSKKLSHYDYSLSPDSRYVTFTAKEQHNNLVATCIVTNNLGSGSANITIHVLEIKASVGPVVATLQPPNIPPPVPPSLVVAIIGICTLFIVIVMSSVLCCLKFYTHRQFINAHMRRQEIYQRHEPSIGCTIAQPEIYFEPKDSISQSTNTSDGTSSTKRSIGIQVLPQVNLELQDIHQQQTLPARYRGRPLPQPGRPSSPMVDCGCSFV